MTGADSGQVQAALAGYAFAVRSRPQVAGSTADARKKVSTAMQGKHPGAEVPSRTAQPVLVVGAGPVGAAAALLLADSGIPVTLLERHLQPHPLPRAVHLDDEVARILHRPASVTASWPGPGRAAGYGCWMPGTG